MNKTTLGFIFFVLCLPFIFSQEAHSDTELLNRLNVILGEKYASNLIKNKYIIVQKYASSNMKSEIAPKTALIEQMSVKSKIAKPAFLAEVLYLYKKEGAKSPDVSKILRNISGLEGIKYFSNTHQTMMPLYLTSYAVKKVETPNGIKYERIDDPFDKEITGLSILARHIDGTFGDYIYKYDYFKNEDNMGMICVNMDTIVYPYLTLLRLSPGNMRVSIAVHDLDNYILIYCSSVAKFPRFPFVGGRIKKSFSTRLNAIYNWFIDEYKEREQKLNLIQ